MRQKTGTERVTGERNGNSTHRKGSVHKRQRIRVQVGGGGRVEVNVIKSGSEITTKGNQ